MREERTPCYLELRERLRNSCFLFYTCFQAVFRVEPPFLTEARKRRQHFFENFGHPSSVTAATNGGAGEFQPPCAIQPSHPLRRSTRLRRARRMGTKQIFLPQIARITPITRMMKMMKSQ